MEEVLASLGTVFIAWLEYNEDEYGNMDREIAELIPIVNDHQADRNMVIDPFITLLACVYRIQNVIHGD